MGIVFTAVSWFLTVLLGLLALSLMLMGAWWQGLVLIGIILMLLPPLKRKFCSFAPCWFRPLAIALLAGLFVWIGTLGSFVDGIYASSDVRAQFDAMYEKKMAAWPVPYEDKIIQTEYGQVHLIVSGPVDAPPLMLFHVSGVPAWSWQRNAGELSRHFRIYAVDTLGDAGKSVLQDREKFPADGKAQAALYSDVMEKLGLKGAYVAGGSEGGFIGTNLALYAPERVRKLALLGPMGYGGTAESVARIVTAQFFPLESVREDTIAWAFGDSAEVRHEFETWFRLVMTGTYPQKAPPVPFTPEQLQQVKIPVLLLLGTKDNLLGDPKKSIALAENIPDLQAVELETGHFIAAEIPKTVSGLLIDFFSETKE